MRRTIETMTRRAVAALGIGACLASAAGALHAQTWMAAYGDGGIDMGRGGVIALPSDGGIVAAGLYDSPFNYHDIFVLKTDGCYTTQWMKRYDLGGYEHATKIRRTADGGFIVVGYAQVAEHCGTASRAETARTPG